MAINRGPWNALVDDDGSNLIGSVWNKDAIKTVLLDPIDLAMAAPVPWTYVSFNQPGTYHDFNPGIIGNTLIELVPAMTITGFKPAAVPFAGQQLMLMNLGTATTSYLHEDTRSSVGARLRCQANTQTVAGYWGFALFQYVPFAGGGMWVGIGRANGHGV